MRRNVVSDQEHKRLALQLMDKFSAYFDLTELEPGSLAVWMKQLHLIRHVTSLTGSAPSRVLDFTTHSQVHAFLLGFGLGKLDLEGLKEDWKDVGT